MMTAEEETAMGIVSLLVVIAIIGLIAWALTQLVPMPAPMQTVIVVVAVLFCLLLVLQVVGFVDIPIRR